EEDELLAERVEAAVVEDDRGDDVGRVPLSDGRAVEEEPERTVEAAEVVQACDAPREQHRKPERRAAEQAEAHAHAQRFRSFTSATTITSGKPITPTVSSLSATSGAWKTRKRTASG